MSISRWMAVALAVALATTAFAGKAEQEKIDQLEERIAALESSIDERLGALEQRIDQKIDEAVQEIAQREERAQEAFRQILATSNRGDQITAKTAMDAFLKKYAGTEAAKQAARLNVELSVVGKPAPAQFEVEKWFAGDGAPVDLAQPGTSLLVFWEEWCPHCKREVPKLKETYDRFKDQGLHVIALTKVNRSATEEKVTAFIETHQLDFPVAKETGSLSQYFNVSGIPAAAVVKDGKVIWRGHPARLSDALIESWL